MRTGKALLSSAISSVLMLGLSAGIEMSPAHADILHNDDVIIFFSLCVGNDCVNGEAFGADTLRLKENNLRIHFDDTSNSASFPNNDWRIVANDQGNGGSNYLAIEDATAGRFPFRVEAGAPANALVVESDGDVGIKTLDPVVDLHIVEGNTPTVRLQQDGSDGFTPQTWDVAGNEANFFIRDVTNGSLLSFKIKPGAPENSVFIDTDGDVGLGTGNPNINNSGDDLVVYDGSGPARLALYNNVATNKVWTLNSNNTLRISSGTSAPELELFTNGNMELGGTCVEFNANSGSRFACTFSAGGGVSCAAAGSNCP